MTPDPVHLDCAAFMRWERRDNRGDAEASRRPAKWTPPASKPAASTPNDFWVAVQRGWQWLQREGKVRIQQKQRRLRVSETVSLGDKRFVSIVEVDGKSFLIGGSAGSVALLKDLSHATEPQGFARVLDDALKQERA